MNFDRTSEGGVSQKYQSLVLFDDITKDWPEQDEKKYLKFLRRECSFESVIENRYIIDKFQLTARASHNKNVRNKKPQVWANLVLGGEFSGPDHKILSDFGKYFYFTIQQ
jgi:hypothetical protein